jgi:hypothetical protein
MGMCRIYDSVGKLSRQEKLDYGHGIMNGFPTYLINIHREGSLDIFPYVLYTYNVNLQRKYREDEDHSEI